MPKKKIMNNKMSKDKSLIIEKDKFENNKLGNIYKLHF
jgi:hypothetical protein